MSRTPPLEPDEIDTLWDVVCRHARRSPDAVALQFEGRKQTYGELLQSSMALAEELVLRGVRPGDRIAYLGKNNELYFALLYAIACLGAVLVPINWRLARAEWEFILRDSQARLLFTDPAFLEAGHALAQASGLVGAQYIPRLASARCEARSESSGTDVVVQVYTSGTTGRPKGAMLSHRNLLALRAPGYAAGLDWFPGPTDSTLVVLPVSHIAGTAYALFGLYGGGRVVIAREFDAGETLRLLAAEHISHVLLAPAVLKQVLEHPEAGATDFSHLRYITYGASPIPEALLRTALQAFGCDFIQMYGMTETAGGVVALSPEDHRADNDDRLRSAGRAMPGVEVVILDEGGRALAPGQVGEVAVRSAAVMVGYWAQPAATAEVMEGQGWLRTGDIGSMDSGGYVFLLDRAKDVINSGGENVYPAEVENAIFGHPDVADVAVIGVPSERWGEEVMAIVVPRPGKTPDLDSIAQWARARVGGFKVPRRLSLVSELPRNAGNKILRRVLREPYWQGLQRRIH
jgi:long-chain acyl-CoA synthetase